MKYIWWPVASVGVMLASCADDYKETIPMPEKPVEVSLAERLSSYDVLSRYAADAGVKMGVAVDGDDFAARGLLYSVVSTNFSQVESAVKFSPLGFKTEENTYDFTPLSTLVDAAGKSGIEYFGPFLCSDVNVPGQYMKSLIATVVIPYQPWSEDIVIADFEGDELGKAYPSAKKDAGKVAVEVAEDPTAVRGKVLMGTKLTMDVPMIADIKLPEGFTLRDVSRVKLKCLVVSGTPTTSRIQVESAGFSEKGNPYKSDQWEDYVFDLSNLKFKDEELARNTIKIGVGAYGSNVTCCIDDVTIQLEHLRGDDTVIEKTPEEKAEIISTELYKWVNGVAETCGETVNEYIIFDEPLDSEGANFHWSDYLGTGYVAEVQKYMDTKTVGAKYYVSQSLPISEMMESDVESLVHEIQTLEKNGVRVDGVNLNLTAGYSLDYSTQVGIDKTTLAAVKAITKLGRPVRIGNFKVNVVDENGMQVNVNNLTDAQRQAVAEYYQLVLSALISDLGDKLSGVSFSTALETTQEAAPWLRSGNRSFIYEGIVRGIAK